jgi:hypothetical protein
MPKWSTAMEDNRYALRKIGANLWIITFKGKEIMRFERYVEANEYLNGCVSVRH